MIQNQESSDRAYLARDYESRTGAVGFQVNIAFSAAEEFYRGKEITNLTLVFSGGRMTSMTRAGPGFEAMKKDYDAVTEPGKDLLSYVDFGISPNSEDLAGEQERKLGPGGNG